MLKSCCFAAAMIAAASGPAFAANDCGSAPLAPAIPGTSDLSGKTVEAGRAEVVDTYHQVKIYQAALKPFRACLLAAASGDKASIADAQAKPDKDSKSKIAALQQEMDDMQKAYDKTVDTETQVATDFNNLHTAQCVKDTDPKICPKKP
ncbi:MAG: hypothetical protein KGM97_01435 [Alphaproteobacteria bacterium]|nr:hypothetical protein [Alphaproteobacteria bacterium]MDE2629626.1 hypothetical protein [Alphaproteobacteria bacterium]